MAKYAVIKIKDNQYKVKEGDEILVNKIEGEPEAEVLLVVNEGDIKVGKPVLTNAKVVLETLEPLVKGEKVNVRTFKAKARYRKAKGFRPQYSRLKVKSIKN